ncbi:MAG: hypothetical protein Q8K78_06600 [Planctomycetaceae bacterium]|nr:hypothetical protein [Planctomycetaceae bacterium]
MRNAKRPSRAANSHWRTSRQCHPARPLKRVIQQRLQNELANRLLAGDFNEGDTITIDVQNGDFTFAT